VVRAEVEDEREPARPEQREIYVERNVRSTEYVFAALITLKRHLAASPGRLKARMESLFSFPVGLFHLPTTCRFIPAHSGSPVIREKSLTRQDSPTSSAARDWRAVGCKIHSALVPSRFSRRMK
jgi:hypothetical protein